MATKTLSVPAYFRTSRLSSVVGMTRSEIARLFDRGEISGYRGSPPKRNRYVDRRSFVRWMLGHGVQHASLPHQLMCDVLILGASRSLSAEIERLLPTDDFRVTAIQKSGQIVHPPKALVIDASSVDPRSVMLLCAIHEEGIAESVAIVPEDGDLARIAESGIRQTVPSGTSAGDLVKLFRGLVV